MKFTTFLHNRPSLLPGIILAALCCAFVVPANAQVWNSNTVTADAPTTCTTGEPITACPISGYRIERASSQTGTFASVGTSTTTTFTHTNAAAGLNCYRWIALSTRGDSAPSAVNSAACRTNVAPIPTGPPNPPTNTRVIETTVFNLTMIERGIFVGSNVGTVPLNTICGKDAVMAGFRIVARSNVTFTRPQPAGTVLVARCG